MTWCELYPSDKQPSMQEMAYYIGNAKDLWVSLISYIENTYKIKPKLSYSNCGMKPGWNVKYAKSGQAFGTLYPEKDSFSVFVVISYKLDLIMQSQLPQLSKEIADLYNQAGDYMKLGKWMMFQINDAVRLEDYKKIINVKLPAKE